MLIRKSLRVAKRQVALGLPRLVATIPVSARVGNIALNPVTNRVYFIQGEHSLGVLDAQTNTIITTLNIGQLPSHLALNARTNRIYVANFLDGTVSVINGLTNRVITTVKVGERCDHIAVNTRTNLIYVTTISLTAKFASVVVLNGTTNKLQRRIRFIGRPSQLVVNELTNRIYVTNTTNDTLSVIHGTRHTILSTVKVGKNPVITPALNRKTNLLYVANNLSRFCSVVNLRTLKVRSIELERRQSNVILNPMTNHIYVTSAQVSEKGKLFAINGDTNRVYRTITVPTFTNTLVNPTTNHLFIAGSSETGTSPLSVYHGTTLKSITTLRIAKGAGDMVMNPRTNRIYIGGENSISVVQD
ncbi:hypothetical protein A8709_15495 [Paenibacillus pectinilyticus]|uniref:Cell surface protein n=1 Tax=Paenibacillus pectinilyticus TaxID=512399 RepID=A0A1C1A4J6_9BACL|nr:YncE family protein [Paenibacillus pectinilyticus]OCT15479.1 hypothetical protein A8709_15495 [Paenibacillus pectinilyticus]